MTRSLENDKGPSIGRHQPRKVNFLADPRTYQEQTGLQNLKTRCEFEMVLDDLTLSVAEKSHHFKIMTDKSIFYLFVFVF